MFTHFFLFTISLLFFLLKLHMFWEVHSSCVCHYTMRKIMTVNCKGGQITCVQRWPQRLILAARTPERVLHHPTQTATPQLTETLLGPTVLAAWITGSIVPLYLQKKKWLTHASRRLILLQGTCCYCSSFLLSLLRKRKKILQEPSANEVQYHHI